MELLPRLSDGSSRGRFFPDQVFKDAVAVFVAFALVFAAAAFLDAPLERLADPTDSSYVPRPEWYFLFLFQALKLFRGPFEVVGSVGLPSAAMAVLVLVPFLDRAKGSAAHCRVGRYWHCRPCLCRLGVH